MTGRRCRASHDQWEPRLRGHRRGPLLVCPAGGDLTRSHRDTRPHWIRRDGEKRGERLVYFFVGSSMAGTLLHVSGLVRRLVQCHIGFLLMWRKKRIEREQGGCSHKLKFRIMRQLFYHYMSCCCHATHNFTFIISINYGIVSYYETT